MFLILFLLQIQNTHRCSDSLIDSVWVLVHLLVPDCVLPQTWRTCQKWLKKFGFESIPVNYCNDCLEYIFTDQRTDCAKCGGKNKKCFSYFTLSSFFKLLFNEDDAFCASFEYLNSHKNDGGDDWYNGSIGRELISKYGSNNIFIASGTDGLSLFNSTRKDAWPILITILNLPECLRYNLESIYMQAFLVLMKKPKSVDILLIPF